jgi:hypothetical protein
LLARLPQQQQQQQQQVWHYAGQTEGQGPHDLLAQQHPERPKSPAWKPVGVAAAAARAVTKNQEYAEAPGTVTAVSRGNSPSRAAAVSRVNSPGRPASRQQQQQQMMMMSTVGFSGSSGGRVSAMGRGTSSSSGGVGAAGARGSSSSRSSSPVKLAAGVQAQLAGYQERLMQLQNRLHSAARPWSQQEHSIPQGGAGSAGTTFVSAFSPTMGSRAAVAGPTLPGRQLPWVGVGPSTAVVVRPQSPEAVAVVSPTAQAGNAQGMGDAWRYGGRAVSPSAAAAAAAAAAQAEWRVVGQPRKSPLVMPQAQAVVAASAELGAAHNAVAVDAVSSFR